MVFSFQCYALAYILLSQKRWQTGAGISWVLRCAYLYSRAAFATRSARMSIQTGSSLGKAPGTAFPQVLGRHSWYVIHAMATAVKDRDSLDGFKSFITVLLQNYPCRRCRENSAEKCKTLLRQLRGLTLGKHQEPNFEPVVWAFRFHACITKSVHEAQQNLEDGAWVSEESVHIAGLVHSAGLDSKVYAIFQQLQKQHGKL